MLEARRAEFGGDWFAERFVAGARAQRRHHRVAVRAARAARRRAPVRRLSGGQARDRRLRREVGRRQLRVPQHGPLVRRRARARARAERLALACWELFALDGYARVDFRVDASGMLFVLEINANPCLSPDAGFAAALEQAGIGYGDAIGWLIADARAARAYGARPHDASRPPFAIASGRRPADVPALRRLVASTRRFLSEERAIALELLEERLDARGEERLLVLLRGARRRAPRLCGVGARAADRAHLRPLLDRRGARGAGAGHRPGAARARRARRRRSRRRQSVHRNVVAEGVSSGRGGSIARPATGEWRALRDFYAPGDHKMMFCKVIRGRR